MLIVAGIALAAVGAAWWFFSRPDEVDLRTEEVSCALRNVTDCELPEAVVVGPVVMAIAGAFLILLGVILLAGRRD